MKLFAKFAALTVMAATATAFAQGAPAQPPPPPPDDYNQAPAAQPPVAQAPAGQPAPSEMPPPPPQAVPAPPSVSAPAAQPVAPPPRTDGEWVYTAQYGYVWMPYGQSYTYVYGDHASMYVFYPHYGWRWVAAPWVLGIGPGPRWGVYGPRRFAWYAHPWFRARVGYGRRVVVRRGRRW